MIEPSKIDDIARRAAVRHLAKAVDSVSSRDTTNSDGLDAIRITIKLRPRTARKLDGDAVLDTLVAIKTDLSTAGEQRPSIIEYEEIGEAVETDDADAKS